MFLSFGNVHLHRPTGERQQVVERRSQSRNHLAKRADVEIALRRLAPKIPPHEFGAVVDHARDSRGLGQASPEEAAWLSLVSYVRHQFTDYEALLAQSYDRDSARFFVAEEIEATLAHWGVRRRLTNDE